MYTALEISVPFDLFHTCEKNLMTQKINKPFGKLLPEWNSSVFMSWRIDTVTFGNNIADTHVSLLIRIIWECALRNLNSFGFVHWWTGWSMIIKTEADIENTVKENKHNNGCCIKVQAFWHLSWISFLLKVLQPLTICCEADESCFREHCRRFRTVLWVTKH